ncbi:ABC transporter ATP-binding protein [Streptomyces purpurogeneiscleroticus]|uniref:ABC transporter ATP-binding protein n=1 Tax=Streptomyces purpurogeneiscleroticus TaxID=68259 RepID=UPI001CBBC680|nr:ABC transporter ATP-binding protein [Streptomyces purpurogeneiscleroticus]MBZ4017960.1 spermidine/putrescine ABC transporter ATP-binding protein [Streptomyces purpurogeneiscleroticus]
MAEDNVPGTRPAPPATAVRLTALTKDFGTVRAVDHAELAIQEGEFFSLLGPSGSGKSTLLRLIAGFERPTSGRVELAGRDVTALPPHRRDVHTVFQDYALFPHMTVEQNVGYALRVAGVRKGERRARAREALATVRLEDYGDRRPAQLSGGQRQRVALARALVDRPGLLLLDEPLGALDLKLRQEMQTELKQIQRTTGITFLLVTHDQEEALTMSDRLAVLDGGRIAQTGPPLEIYDRPATAFVAGFVGVTNLVRGAAAQRLTGRPGMYSIRPERIRITPFDERDGAAAGSPGERSVTGRITDIAHAGPHTRFRVRLDEGGDRLTVLRLNTSGPALPARADTPVRLAWDAGDAYPVPG